MDSYIFLGNIVPIYQLCVFKSERQVNYSKWLFKVTNFKSDEVLHISDNPYQTRKMAIEKGFEWILGFEGNH